MFPSPTKNFHTDGYAAISPSRPALSTKGRNILITGGGAGVGRLIAEGFAESGAAAIALVGRTEATLKTAQEALSKAYEGTKIFTYTADMADLTGITHALEKFTEDANGKIDVLVANAAYMPDWKSIADSDPKDWWKAYDITVRGTYNTLKAFQPRAAEDAVALNVTTAAAGMPYIPNASAYATSKLAAAKIWEYFGQENPSLTAISFHPGVHFSTTSGVKASSQGLVMPEDEPGLPQGFAVWLASPEAKFLNGKMVWAQWDVEELKSNAAQIQNGLMFNLGHKNFPDMIPFEG